MPCDDKRLVVDAIDEHLTKHAIVPPRLPRSPLPPKPPSPSSSPLPAGLRKRESKTRGALAVTAAHRRREGNNRRARRVSGQCAEDRGREGEPLTAARRRAWERRRHRLRAERKWGRERNSGRPRI